MGKKLRVGVIGVGGIGRIHISSYQKTGEVEVVAVSDASLNKVKQVEKEFGIPRGYKDPEEMLEKENLDAVSICTPNFLHASQSILSLDKGCHVLLEKPMATNTREAREIVKKAKESGKVLMMGMTWRFMSSYSYLKRLAQQGEFGDIYYAQGKWLRRRGVPGMGGWFTTKKMSGGGPLVDIGVHALDCLLWIMDFPRPERVSGFAFQRFGFRAGDGGWPPPVTRDEQDIKTRVFDVEDLAGGIIHFSGGKVAILEASWALNLESANGISLAGDRGGATAPPVKIYRERNGVQETIIPEIPEGETYVEEVKEFLRCIKEGKEPSANAEKGYEVLRILEAIYTSSREKREVQL